jgi:hypothetical protein
MVILRSAETAGPVSVASGSSAADLEAMVAAAADAAMVQDPAVAR